MVFSSLLFMYAFLPATMVLYWLMPNLRAKNNVLLIASLIFYAWGGPRYLILLLLMTLISWLGARMIGRLEAHPKARTVTLWVTTLCQLGLLGYFKYAGFLTTLSHQLTGWPHQILSVALPIGISFYTFQLITYTVDVYRHDAPAQQSYWMVLLYAALFFQCIAGPIVRYQDVADEIMHRQTRWDEISRGISRFAVGLFKKAVLANSVAALADQLLPLKASALQPLPAGALALGLLMYMIQIYLDFSAYSDMAIGMGWMVGFHFKENFNYPYIAQSITEFWRRWHISLSSFFRDYVYIPLGGNRKGALRQIFNMFVVWAATGFWHGAHWNYILWGLYFFVFLVLEKWVLKGFFNHCPRIFKHLYLLIVVYFGWLLFRFTDFNTLAVAAKGLLTLNGNAWMNVHTQTVLMNNLFIMMVALLACLPWWKNGYQAWLNWANRLPGVRTLANLIDAIAPVILVAVATLMLVGNSYNPFLYFQF